jgi:hypothetical protein
VKPVDGGVTLCTGSEPEGIKEFALSCVIVFAPGLDGGSPGFNPLISGSGFKARDDNSNDLTRGAVAPSVTDSGARESFNESESVNNEEFEQPALEKVNGSTNNNKPLNIFKIMLLFSIFKTSM